MIEKLLLSVQGALLEIQGHHMRLCVGNIAAKLPIFFFSSRKCTKQQDAFDEEKFEREFKARVMSRILEKGDKEDVSGETDHDEHKETDRLPPLPTDDEYDDEVRPLIFVVSQYNLSELCAHTCTAHSLCRFIFMSVIQLLAFL
ncbi:unnamed protein product [Cylicostephanus goldi]|uniref:Uncharacterized protein n=1 Tax=Cylicostephanus goldi TaxID=71465 RepID=A0A3P7QIP5_CYLGO|nr:unnamed protein product [Cylicostephanus goldi]